MNFTLAESTTIHWGSIVAGCLVAAGCGRGQHVLLGVAAGALTTLVVSLILAYTLALLHHTCDP